MHPYKNPSTLTGRCFGAGLSNTFRPPASFHAKANIELTGLPAKRERRIQSPGDSYIQYPKPPLIDSHPVCSSVGRGSGVIWAALGKTAITLLTRTLDISHKARQAAHQQVCRVDACQERCSAKSWIISPLQFYWAASQHPWNAHQVTFPSCKHKSCCKGGWLGSLFLSFKEMSDYFFFKLDEIRPNKRTVLGNLSSSSFALRNHSAGDKKEPTRNKQHLISTVDLPAGGSHGYKSLGKKS